MVAFLNDQVNGFGSDKFNVRAGGIKMSVIGNDVTLLASDAKENALSGASLVSGDDISIAKNILDRTLKVIEAPAAGVTLVTFHDGGPLMR